MLANERANRANERANGRTKVIALTRELAAPHWKIAPSIVQLAAVVRVEYHERVVEHPASVQGVHCLAHRVVQRHHHRHHHPAAVVLHVGELVDELLRRLVRTVRGLQRQVQVHWSAGVMAANQPRRLTAVQHGRVRAVPRGCMQRARRHNRLALRVVVYVDSKSLGVVVVEMNPV